MIRPLTAVVTVLVGTAFLLWRAQSTLTGVPVALAVAALCVDVAGVAAVIALLAALRRPSSDSSPPSGPDPRSATRAAPGDVVPTAAAERRDALGRHEDATSAVDPDEPTAAFAITPPHGTTAVATDRRGARGGAPTGRTAIDTALDTAVDVVVRFDAQPIGHLHATLAGVRFMYAVRSITVVASGQFEAAVAALAGTRVSVVGADRRDAAALDLAQQQGSAPLIAVFDAGDVPLPWFAGQMSVLFADPSVAVAQARLMTDDVDSSEHDPRGRHELQFEREVLNPALGARGAAVFCGSGGVIRRSVLDDTSARRRRRWSSERSRARRSLRSRRARRTVELQWSIRVRARGHRIVAPRHPAVIASLISSERAVLAERRRCAAAALGTLASAQNPLWRGGLRLSERLGYLAWMVRPLSGLRRVAFIAILAVALAVGSVPLTASWWGIGALWLPWLLLQTSAIDRFSDGTLPPGARARWSVRTMGPALAALLGAGRDLAGAGISSGRRGGAGNALKNRALVIGLLVMAAVTTVAAVDRWRPFLPEMATVERAGLLAVALWMIAVLLDTMRCLIGGPLLRRSERIDVGLRAVVSGRAAVLVNLSPLGAGIRFDDGSACTVNDVLDVVFDVPSSGGQSARVEARALVRNIRAHRDGPMCGAEFGAMSRSSADALYTYCVVLHRVDLIDGSAGAPIGAAPVPTVGAVSHQRRGGVRLVGLASLLGVLVATVPPYGSSSSAGAERAAGSIEVFIFDDR
ncbi:MAG: hypothetical protein AAB131_21970, partial [Actinomycetota bacterium]